MYMCMSGCLLLPSLFMKTKAKWRNVLVARACCQQTLKEKDVKKIDRKNVKA